MALVNVATFLILSSVSALLAPHRPLADVAKQAISLRVSETTESIEIEVANASKRRIRLQDRTILRAPIEEFGLSANVYDSHGSVKSICAYVDDDFTKYSYSVAPGAFVKIRVSNQDLKSNFCLSRGKYRVRLSIEKKNGLNDIFYAAGSVDVAIQ